MMKNYRVAMMKSFTEFKAYTSIGVLCLVFCCQGFLRTNLKKKKPYIIQYKCQYFKGYNFFKIILMFRFYLKMSVYHLFS